MKGKFPSILAAVILFEGCGSADPSEYVPTEQEAPAPAPEPRFESDKPDPLACNTESEPFSDYVFTRGGTGQNRQATITVCIDDLKVSALYETEVETVGVGLRYEGCEELGWRSEFGSITLDRPSKTWDEFKTELMQTVGDAETPCQRFAEIEEQTLELIKPAFLHVIDTLARERIVNAQAY